jgi:hypothetical protein
VGSSGTFEVTDQRLKKQRSQTAQAANGSLGTFTSEDVISFFLIFNFCRDTTEVKIPSLPSVGF